MPLYEFKCAACEKIHEVMQKFSDEPMKICPDCHGPVEKMISLGSFALKGSGWYTTDYKRAKTSPEKSTSSADSGGTKTETKSDAAPATSTETKAAAAPQATPKTAPKPSSD